jgi:hypothetical protein
VGLKSRETLGAQAQDGQRRSEALRAQSTDYVGSAGDGGAGCRDPSSSLRWPAHARTSGVALVVRDSRRFASCRVTRSAG